MKVYFKDFLNKTKEKFALDILPIPIGFDNMGNCVVGDLRKLGHILIGGATGSGKSIFNLAIIYALIQKYTSKELRFFLEDLKRVELLSYNGFPHLLSNVEVECEKCLHGLARMADEKDRRIKRLDDAKCSDIEVYNTRFTNNKIPYLIVIIDTFSDLSMYNKTIFEQLIQNLTYDAVKAGVHLIMCDSRVGSVLYTNTIMKCFPTKIAFKVASSEGSEEFIGESGAEILLGRGDMLFLGAGEKQIAHLHAPILSSEEIEAMIRDLK